MQGPPARCPWAPGWPASASLGVLCAFQKVGAVFVRRGLLLVAFVQMEGFSKAANSSCSHRRIRVPGKQLGFPWPVNGFFSPSGFPFPQVIHSFGSVSCVSHSDVGLSSSSQNSSFLLILEVTSCFTHGSEHTYIMRASACRKKSVHVFYKGNWGSKCA